MTKSLIELAQDGTDDARQQLFTQVSTLVISNLEERTDQELAIFAEVIIKLYGVGSAEDRARLAQKLSTQENAPYALAKKLAQDEVEIASPLLANSPIFSQENLLNFVESLSNSHLKVLAGRNDLSTEVSDVIAGRGNRPVQRILSGNREIKLSRHTMLSLVKQAMDDAVLRKNMSLRTDLSPAACRLLLPHVNAESQKRLHNIIEGSLSKDQLEQISRLKSLRREYGSILENTDMSLLWREAERVGITVNELMILLLQDSRFNHATELLSARGRTAQKSLKDAVYAGKQELVLKAAHKAGLDAPTFALFARARCEHLKVPSSQSSEWTAAYKKYLEKNNFTRQNRCEDFKTKRPSKKPLGMSARGSAASAV